MIVKVVKHNNGSISWEGLITLTIPAQFQVGTIVNYPYPVLGKIRIFQARIVKAECKIERDIYGIPTSHHRWHYELENTELEPIAPSGNVYQFFINNPCTESFLLDYNYRDPAPILPMLLATIKGDTHE